MRHRLALFCAAQGLEVALLPELVEAFVAEGLPGKAASTKGTYRSVLRSLGGSGRPVLAPPFSGSAARAPYNAGERAELASVAASQPSPWRRASASAFLALGIGAGLRAGELAAATGDDVIAGRGRVRVHVGAGRVVPVAGVYAKDLACQAKNASTSHLFCPGGANRRYRNFVSNFCYELDADPAAPEVVLSAGPLQFHLRPFGRGDAASGTALPKRYLRGRVAAALCPLRPGGAKFQSRAAKGLSSE